MRIAKSMDELARRISGKMSKNHRKQGIACDIKWNSEKHIRTSLIKLTRKLAIYNIELKKCVTRRKSYRLAFSCHLINKLRIPCRNYNMTPLRSFFDFFNCPLNLINFSAITCGPSSPLYS